MAKVIRTLFTQIPAFISPENQKRLLEMFKTDLAKDFIREIGRTAISVEEGRNCELTELSPSI